MAAQAPAAVGPGVVMACPASVSRKGFGCPASVFPSGGGGLRVSRMRRAAIPRAQVRLRRPWLPESEPGVRGQRSFYDPGVKHLGRSSYLDQFGSPELTVGRTWEIEVLVPAARAALRKARKRRQRRARKTPAEPRGPERWREWRRMLDEGVYPTKAALARGEGVSRAAVTQGLRPIDRPPR